MAKHPITHPSIELVSQWANQSPVQPSDESWAYELFIVDKAVRFGADQELEACRLWVSEESIYAARDLVEARRPKPPSLKEQALQALGHLDKGAEPQMDTTEAVDTIRRALESLPD